jgi:hypothetical protein
MTLIPSFWYAIGVGGYLKANQDLPDEVGKAYSAGILWTGHDHRTQMYTVNVKAKDARNGP